MDNLLARSLRLAPYQAASFEETRKGLHCSPPNARSPPSRLWSARFAHPFRCRHCAGCTTAPAFNEQGIRGGTEVGSSGPGFRTALFSLAAPRSTIAGTDRLAVLRRRVARSS